MGATGNASRPGSIAGQTAQGQPAKPADKDSSLRLPRLSAKAGRRRAARGDRRQAAAASEGLDSGGDASVIAAALSDSGGRCRVAVDLPQGKANAARHCVSFSTNARPAWAELVEGARSSKQPGGSTLTGTSRRNHCSAA